MMKRTGQAVVFGADRLALLLLKMLREIPFVRLSIRLSISTLPILCTCIGFLERMAEM